MTSLDDISAGGVLGNWAMPLLTQLRARRERAQAVIAQQSELLLLLEASFVTEPTESTDDDAERRPSWLHELKEQQFAWQQRQEDHWQQQLSTLEALVHQVADLSETVQHAAGPNAGRTAGQDAAATGTTASNWEQAKQRLLAELDNPTTEAETKDEPRKPAVKSRRDWQQEIAGKDAEILRLKFQLEQSTQPAIPPMLVLPEAVEIDELIQIERKNLQRLQEE